MTHTDSNKVLPSNSAPGETLGSAGTGPLEHWNNGTDSNLVLTIQYLQEEDAKKEVERAEEKIRQKIKPLSKITAVRQSLTSSFHERDDDRVNKNDSKSQDMGSIVQDPTSSLSPLSKTGTSASNQVDDPSTSSSGDGTSNAATSSDREPIEPGTSGDQETREPKEPSHRPTESSISRLIYNKSRKAAKPTESQLITVEAPRLVDVQSALDDRRFFQLSSDPEPEGDFVYEFLYQHQRGAFFLGTPKFSSKSLLPVDPDEWTDNRFEISAMDITNYELPDPSWEWVHKSWLVDMTSDVDEDGWEYAMTFHGSPWHGNHEVLRSFARRRRWLRLRKRKGTMMNKAAPLPERVYPTSVSSATWTKLDLTLDEPSPFPEDLEDLERGDSKRSKDNGKGKGKDKDKGTGMLEPSPSLLKPIDLYKILKKARSDREKLAYAAQYVVRYPGEFSDLETRLDKYLNLFDYESSRRDFLTMLSVYGRNSAAVQAAVNRLEFYSDQKVVLNKYDKTKSAKLRR
ncbi:hypothetical protein BGZ94_005159 [Podila epigama]|nr:hypothetical protein BGZ94_005159 [Podila epigama]